MNCQSERLIDLFYAFLGIGDNLTDRILTLLGIYLFLCIMNAGQCPASLIIKLDTLCWVMSNLFITFHGGVIMKKLFMLLPLVFLLCVSFGCQKQVEDVAEEPAVDVEADVAAIKGILAEWVEAYNANELDRLVDFYFAENAVGMYENIPTIEGKEAILANMKAEKEKYDSICESSIVKDARVCGDLAVVRGNDTGTATPKAGGESFQYDSKWVAVFERQPDGKWKCIWEIGNSNLPLPSREEDE
jgi:ketosteroid isomerase-like protein